MQGSQIVRSLDAPSWTNRVKCPHCVQICCGLTLHADFMELTRVSISIWSKSLMSP